MIAFPPLPDHLRPEPRFGIPDTVTPEDIARGWLQLLDDNGLEVVATEAKVVNDELRLAGTLDRLVRLTRPLTFGEGDDAVTIAAGSVVVLDIKSSKLRADDDGLPGYWASYPIQIYAYATGVPYHIDEHWEDG